MRLKSLLIVPLLVTSLQAASVDDLTFTLNGGGTEYSVAGCLTSASGSLVIPSIYNELPVTSIGPYTFNSCSSLINITIPESVTSIGEWAFRNCTSLVSVIIPEGVTSIGPYTFYNCTSLTTITLPNSVTSIGPSAFYNTKLTSITIPNGVSSIGENAFEQCGNLTSITIPDSVTSIGDSAFYYCTSLTSIAIPDSVTSVGEFAFYECSGLTSITIGGSVTSIGPYTFAGCGSLISATFGGDAPTFGTDVFFRSNSVTIYYDSDYSGWSSQVAGRPAFRTSTLLFTLNESGNEYILTDCLDSTSGSLEIPNTYNGLPVSSIWHNTFSGCSSLTSITIPDSVTSIGDYAFYACSGLPSITIPDSVISIGDSAFGQCDGLTSITIPDSVTSLGKCVSIMSLNLTNVTIGSGVTSIGEASFATCKKLTSITIPDSVTSIGRDAFNYCTSLASITIPDGVNSIGNQAFTRCSSLTSITFEGDAPAFGTDVFLDSDSVTIYYDPDYSGWSSQVAGRPALPNRFIADTDGDGLTDAVETNTGIYLNENNTGTNPDSTDSDGDGLSDGIETNTGVFVSFTDTGTDPNNIDSLHTPSEMSAAIAASITSGRNDVTNNPAQYGLFTSSDLSIAQSSSRTEGQQDVISSPSDYDLMSAEGVFDMRVSQPGISMNGDKASMNFTIQSSNDLGEWNNEETIQREYTMPSDKNFMRVSVVPAEFFLTTIATDTYGDKLVYDVSNNLYVNDVNTPLMIDGGNLKTDNISGWDFYAIEPIGDIYFCIIKTDNLYLLMLFGIDGNFLSYSSVPDVSVYENDFGQSLN